MCHAVRGHAVVGDRNRASSLMAGCVALAIRWADPTEVNAIAGSIAAAVEQQGAATAEIARAISETATAANAMTTRTAEVSGEASATGRQATEVRENATGLDRAVEELRHAVIRIVRSSTPEVDRRTNARRAIDIACRLIVDGQTRAARMVDLSNTGAQVCDTPGLRAGQRGTLAVVGVTATLTFSVAHCDGGGAGLAVAPDAANAGTISQIHDRQPTLHAA
jgi:methyl-accepting chemotaxis protein